MVSTLQLPGSKASTSREHFCFPPGRTKFSSALNTKPLLFLSFVVTLTVPRLSLFCDVDYCGKPCITEDTSVPDSPPLDFSRLYTGFRCVKPYVALLGVCVCVQCTSYLPLFEL